MRVAISGVGRMGLRHIDAATESNLDIVGIHDPHALAVDLARQKVGLDATQGFSNLTRMLNETTPDGLIIASTADGHYETCSAAISHGVPFILCEKPFTRNVAEAESLTAAAALGGITLAVNHQVRFTNRFRLAKALYASGLFGQLVTMNCTTGNIGLAMGVSHYLDFFQLLASERIHTVSFVADPDNDTNPRGSHFQDPAGRLSAQTARGLRCHIDFASQSGHGMTTVLGGEYGQVVINDLTGDFSLSFRQPADQALPKTRYGTPGINGILSVDIETAAESTTSVWGAIIQGENFPTASDGTQIVRALAAAELSHAHDGISLDIMDSRLDSANFTWA